MLSRPRFDARLPVPSGSEPRRVRIQVDGEALEARQGESVAAALLAAGRLVLRRSRAGEGRGVFCGMGVCFDCLVRIDGRPNVQACLVGVAEGMCVETHVETQQGPDPAEASA